MIETILFPFVNCRWSCSNKAHLPFKHIQKLWKFIDGCFSYKITDSLWLTVLIFFLASYDPWVIIHFEHHAIFDFVLFHKFFFALFSIHIHTSELIHFKFFTIFSDPDLREKDRSWIFKIYHWTDYKRKQPGENKADHTSDYIDQAFYSKFTSSSKCYTGRQNLELSEFS